MDSSWHPYGHGQPLAPVGDDKRYMKAIDSCWLSCGSGIDCTDMDISSEAENALAIGGPCGSLST